MNEIIQYVRVKRGKMKGQARGVVVAVAEADTIKIGWSRANTKLGDTFNRQRGIEIARSRALSGRLIKTNEIPHDVLSSIRLMIPRSERYFKGAKSADNIVHGNYKESV